MNAGFWYSIDDLRNGVYPALSDSVTISYTVKLIPDPSKPDLKEVDWETLGSASTRVLLSSAISGLQQGLILFPDSSSGRIYIPSGLAFGVSAHYDSGTHVSIKPNANLLYEIKLTSVKGTRLTSDISTIDSYLQSNDKAPPHDVSGIRYTLDTTTQTSKKKPVEGDSINVSYKEDILTMDTSKVILKKFAWKDQITAWRIMLPKYLTEGSTITMYVPSGYAYGSSVKGSIPANSNLKYSVTFKVN